MKKELEVVTVKELIKELSKLDLDKEVTICGSDLFYIYDLEDYILIDHTELDEEEEE